MLAKPPIKTRLQLTAKEQVKIEHVSMSVGWCVCNNITAVACMIYSLHVNRLQLGFSFRSSAAAPPTWPDSRLAKDFLTSTMRSMCRIRPDMSRMDVGDGHGNGPQPRPPMNQLGHVVLRVRYRPENLIDGIQDARHQPHVRCQAAPTQILRQARVVLFRFWVDRGAALLESATGEMTYLLLCKPHHLLFDRDGGGESSTRGLWYSMCTGKMV